MEYLILQMLVFLLVAFLLGLILGWLLSRGDKNTEKTVSEKKPEPNNAYGKKIITDEPAIKQPEPVKAAVEEAPEQEERKEEVVQPSTNDQKATKTPVISEVSYTANVAKKVENNNSSIVTPVKSEAKTTLNEIDLDTKVDLNGKGYGIQHIEGIGPKTGDALRAIGINKVGDLLKITLKPEQRASLAAQLNLKQEYIDRWASMCDFLRITGVDHQASELINAAGPKTVQEFAAKNPEEFVAQMKVVNEAKSKLIAPEVPSLDSVSNWISQAKNLKALVIF